MRVGASGGWGKKLVLCRRQAEIAAPKHGGRQAVHDWLSLHMEVAEQFIGPPPPDHAEAITVDAGAEKCHSAACPSGSDRDISEGVGRIGMEVEDGTDTCCDVRSRNVAKRGRRGGANSVEGCVRRGALRSECEDPSGKRGNRAQGWVA